MTSVTDIPPEATQQPRIATPVGVTKDAKPEDRPDCERPSLKTMRPKWELPDLLLGGTEAFHAAGEKVMAREQDETQDEFNRRMARTVLTNYYGDTIDRHSALPFAKPIVFEPPLPDRLKYLETNCDGAGRSITTFSREVMREGMHRGLAHVLVDAPPGSGDSYEDTLKRQPVLLHIKPGDMLDAHDEPTASGEDHVTYARLMQCELVPSGTFGHKRDEFVMVLDAIAKQVVNYRKTTDGGWLADDPRPYPRDSVPLFTFYAKQVAEYEGEPAYGYLAELNRTHFQSDGEQRHGLSYGRRSTLVQTGWKEDVSPAEAVAKGKKPGPIRAALGWARRLITSAPEGRAYFLETGGAGLAAGEVDLKGLQERMERFGAAQISKGGGITATSRQLDNQRDTCNLEAWCTRLEAVLLAAVHALAKWSGVVLPANQKVSFDRSFAETAPGSTEMPLLIQMAEKRLLPAVVLLREAKARGVLRTVSNPDEIIEMLAEEQAQLAEFDMKRMAQDAIARRAGEPAPDAPTEPTDEQTFNELSLSIDRLSKIKDTTLIEAVRRKMAEHLGVAAPPKLRQLPDAPKPAFGQPPAVGPGAP